MDLLAFFKEKPISPETNKMFIDIKKDLFAAGCIIINKENWCQRAMVRNADGEQLFDPFDKTATQWDILGALHKVDASKYSFTYMRIAAKLAGYTDLDRFNDFSSHEMVLEFFDAAFAELNSHILENK